MRTVETDVAAVSLRFPARTLRYEGLPRDAIIRNSLHSSVTRDDFPLRQSGRIPFPPLHSRCTSWEHHSACFYTSVLPLIPYFNWNGYSGRATNTRPAVRHRTSTPFEPSTVQDEEKRGCIFFFARKEQMNHSRNIYRVAGRFKTLTARLSETKARLHECYSMLLRRAVQL